MEQLRKFLAGICAILFVFSGVAALLLFNIERQAFTSTTYKQAFEDQNLYQRMPEILANTLYTANSENANTDPYLKSLTVEDWQSTIMTLLPPQDLKALTDNTLDSVFDYLNGKTNSAVISLLPLKLQLAGPSGVEVVNQILQAQPDCTTEQLLQLGLGLLNGDVGLCNPPAELMGLMSPLIESQVQTMTSVLPDEITVMSGENSGTANDLRIRLNRVRALMKSTPVFPLLFLFITTIFAVRSLVEWLKWWGYPFLITGALSALFALMGSPIFSYVARRIIQNQGAGFIPPILLSTFQETINAVTGQILKPVVTEGAIIALIGFIMVITALLITRRDAHTPNVFSPGYFSKPS
jgi:hypothetical protein